MKVKQLIFSVVLVSLSVFSESCKKSTSDNDTPPAEPSSFVSVILDGTEWKTDDINGNAVATGVDISFKTDKESLLISFPKLEVGVYQVDTLNTLITFDKDRLSFDPKAVYYATSGFVKVISVKTNPDGFTGQFEFVGVNGYGDVINGVDGKLENIVFF